MWLRRVCEPARAAAYHGAGGIDSTNKSSYDTNHCDKYKYRHNADEAVKSESYSLPVYCPSLTCSIHSTTLPSSFS